MTKKITRINSGHETEKLHRKQTETNYEVQYPVNPMLEDEIENKKLSLKW